MRRSKAVAFLAPPAVSLLAALLIAVTWPASVPASASDLYKGGETGMLASFYSYDVETRLWLNARRPRFDAGDGLQSWEVWLLAMDPSPSGPGR